MDLGDDYEDIIPKPAAVKALAAAAVRFSAPAIAPAKK